MANRPLSPHLTDGLKLHWKWGPAMFVSILHRATGDGMAVVGLGVLVWWLTALAGGAESYASFVDLATSPVGYVVLVGLSWAFFTHMMSGLRHFVLDIGAGYELGANKLWSILSPVIAIVLTIGFWAIMLTKMGVL
ncbi:MAG: succinate dehydrogenase, cytochrome b556 subunit [Erythrobacter sp.]